MSNISPEYLGWSILPLRGDTILVLAVARSRTRAKSKEKEPPLERLEKALERSGTCSSARRSTIIGLPSATVTIAA